MDWLGLDVGGANLKVADRKGFARSLPFALWERPRDLAVALKELLVDASVDNGIAVTMTGELADCFETKTHGVLHILEAVEQATESRRILVYCVNGQFASVAQARSIPLLAAASNWHALARFACRLVQRFPAVLIDVGSTTTDIVRLSADGPITTSTTDTQRLLCGELVYTGISRTSIAAITPVLPYRGRFCPVAAEVFATAADVAVMLGTSPEQPLNYVTADGRPLTKSFSRDRIARMLCSDRGDFTYDDALSAAQFAWDRQAEKIGQALKQVIDPPAVAPASILVSGSGEPLAEAAVRSAGIAVEPQRMSTILGPELSSVAPAFAVAVLASQVESKS